MKGLCSRLPALAISPAVVLAASLAVCHAANFYVATNGNDSNQGTISQPFASLTKARDAARLLGTNAIRNIFIRGGEYFNTAVVLQRRTGADDSGLTIQGYPGEEAILYGGMLITNWTSVSNGWYAAPLPPYPSAQVSAATALTNWQVRMLLVDGQMAQRAQYPTNTYSLYYSDTNGTTTMHYANNDLGVWLVLANAEIQVDFSWDQQTTGASAIDTVNHAVTLSPPISNEPNLHYTGVHSYRVYNIAQGMSKPGQFFYDRGSQSIVYSPIGGKDPNTSECIVPTTTRVFYINGGWNTSSFPWGITLSNLTIAVATMDLQAEGWDGWSLAPKSSLISAWNCTGTTISSMILGRTAGNAIVMNHSLTNATIINNQISNCGAGGVLFCGSGFCLISNNFFNSIGNICYQSPAIVFPPSGNPIVTRNSIYNCKTAGIGSPAPVGGTVSFNSLSNSMQVLRDAGAIYLGPGTNVVITGNFFQHIGGYANDGTMSLDFFRHAIYLDQNSTGCSISNNITLDVPRPLMLDWVHNNTINNNFFINTSDVVQLLFRHSITNAIVFQNNICYSTRNLYASGYTSDSFVNEDNWNFVIDWRSNIFYSVIGGATGHTNTIINETGVAGIPTNSVTSNPLFTSLSPLNLSFQAGSPAPALGISSLSLGGIGAVQRHLGGATNLHRISN